MAIIDMTGKTIKIADSDLVRVDGIGVFKKIERDGILYLQFCDNDRYRAKCRGTRFVEIPLSVLVEKITQIPEVKDKTNEQIT